MRRSTAARLAVALAVLVAACSPTSDPSPTAPAASGDAAAASHRPAPASLNPCASPIEHLTAFANRLGGQLAKLRPLVTDPAFDSSATAAGIRSVSGTLTDFVGLEDRLGGCPQTAPIAASVAAVRADARVSIEASSRASIQDAITQRAVAAALFGLLPDVEGIAAATRTAATAAGVDTDVAVVPDGSAEPLGSLPPLATATPEPSREPPPVATYDAAFFGPNATVTTYRVTGSTPLDIVASIRAHGPLNDWLGQRAEAQTLAVPHLRIDLIGSGSTCRIVAAARPAVSFSFTITLPRWDPGSGASPATVTWWDAELGRAATHENHHVDLWRAAGVSMTKATTTSTCANLQGHLATIVKSTTRANCEFDMAEYGRALGLSLDACVAP